MRESANQFSRKRLIGILTIVALVVFFSSCNRTLPPETAVTPDGLVLAGQKETCGNGPRHRVFRIPATHAQVQLGMGFKTEGWTFGGTIPAPVVEVCEGDTVTIIVPNEDTDPVMGTDHGLDSHAFIIDAAQYDAVAPGKTLEYTGKMEVPGVFMYHCAVGPATDWHIKNGMYGAMIVYPQKSLRDAKEILVVQSAIYGVQTASVPPGGGAMFEFRPPKGNSVLVDHDNLRFLDYGFAIPFVGE